MRARALRRAMAVGASLLWFSVNPGCAQIVGINDPVPTCANGVKDADEEGVDCGGSCVGACPGGHCTMPGDCASGHCGTDGKCVEPSCGDKIWNGGETDVDCGGASANAMCPRCANGRHCSANGDCLSRICTSGTCACSHCSSILAGQVLSPKEGESVCPASATVFGNLLTCICTDKCKLECLDCSKPLSGNTVCSTCFQNYCLKEYTACAADK